MEPGRELRRRLQALNIPFQETRHPPLFSAQDRRRHGIEIPGADTKSLFLRDRGGAFFLLLARSLRRIDLKSLASVIGAEGRFSFAGEEELMRILGVAPGHVTPLAVINDSETAVSVLVDASLLKEETLNTHPLQNDSSLTLAVGDLLHFLEAEAHPPRLIDLDRMVLVETPHRPPCSRETESL